ncbi:MAG TPA: L,D-transpeptidase [Gemmatirosa sp.]
MSTFRRITVTLAALALTFPAARVASAQRASRPTVPAPTRAARGPVVASTTATPDDTRDSTIASDGLANGEVLSPASERRVTHYRSRSDSVAGVLAERALARTHSGMRVAVSLEDRVLHVLDGDDTLLVAAIATGMDTTITFGAKSWTFQTPRGRRTVLGKQENPVWVPPEWHYAETAKNMGLKLAHMPERGSVSIGKGRLLTVRGGKAGVIEGGKFEELPVDEEIIFNNTLYIPPSGTANRTIDGELGRFRLALGDGYYFHGTPHEDTIGDAATHGCIRLYDEDIEWLYQHVPVGTPVYIF